MSDPVWNEYGQFPSGWGASRVNSTGAGVSVVGGQLTARTSFRMQAEWVSGAVVQNDTVYFTVDAPYAGQINSLKYFTGAGSFTVAIKINGVAVTGLGAVTVNSSTPATTNATAANTFNAGDTIEAVITGATGTPIDAVLSLNCTWTS